MNDSNNVLKKEIEALLNKTIEANKVFVTESSGLLRQMGAGKGDATKINIFQNEFLSKALTAYASLNIQHAQNMLDLGISLVRSVNAPGASAATQEEQPTTAAPETEWEPAFILSGTAKAGATLKLSFIVDNHKKETVPCELIHSHYVKDRYPSITRAFTTSFAPDRFTLEPGWAQPVDIQIRSTKNTPPGIYESQVQIKGFEPAYFSIQLTII